MNENSAANQKSFNAQMATKTCSNPFLEDDGFCNKCNKYHFQISHSAHSYGKIIHYEDGMEASDDGAEGTFGGLIFEGTNQLGIDVDTTPEADEIKEEVQQRFNQVLDRILHKYGMSRGSWVEGSLPKYYIPGSKQEMAPEAPKQSLNSIDRIKLAVGHQG